MSSAREKVTIKVDGVSVAVDAGTNVLEAIKKAKGEISYFCYHPGLSVVAVCRQCLVRIEGMPKLMPACQMIVKQDMEVANSSPEVLEARRAMLEFTLLNHPIDCPICDKAGECALQKQYMEWNREEARGSDLLKIRKNKVVDVGPRIVLDAERCILCTRCIRVCDEVAGEHELEMAWRGAHEELMTAPGRKLENPYSLNTVDVCPVGALTSKDFRFKSRVWELYSTPTICNGCATGCNVEIHHKQGTAHRLVPRENLRVNRYWMCDDGRLTYRELSDSRIERARVDGQPASLDDAVARAAEAIDSGRRNVGIVLSARATNEANYLAAKIALDYLALGQVYLAGRGPWQGDEILKNADRNPNTSGARAVTRGKAKPASALAAEVRSGAVKTLLVLDSDLELDCSPAHLIVLAWQESTLTTKADILLPAAAWAETDGTLTNAKRIVQRQRAALAPPGQALSHLEILTRIGRKLGLAIEPRSPQEVFDEMKRMVPGWGVVEFGRSLPPTLLRFADSRG